MYFEGMKLWLQLYLYLHPKKALLVPMVQKYECNMVVKNFKTHIMNKILAILPGTSCIINWAVIQLFMLEFPFTLLTPKCYCLEINSVVFTKSFLNFCQGSLHNVNWWSHLLHLTCMFQKLRIQFGILNFFFTFHFFHVKL